MKLLDVKEILEQIDFNNYQKCYGGSQNGLDSYIW